MCRLKKDMHLSGEKEEIKWERNDLEWKEALLQRRIFFYLFFFVGAGGVYSTYALQQLLINTTLQLTIQYMLHWIEAKDLRGFFGGGGSSAY